MKCPLCNVDLVMSERQGIEIDYCPQCRGVWLDRGELDKIIERSNASASAPAREERREPDRERGYDRDYDRKRDRDYDKHYDKATTSTRRRKRSVPEAFLRTSSNSEIDTTRNAGFRAGVALDGA